MSHQNTDMCLNRSHFTLNLGKRLRVYTLPFIVKVLTFAP